MKMDLMTAERHRSNSVSRWLKEHNKACDMVVNEIRWEDSGEWSFDDGVLRHRTGGFFSLTGVRAKQKGKCLVALDQPLIDQPEIGILGFIIRLGEVGFEILVQAKPEPGNVNFVHAAPSVQATESNYKQYHGGKPTSFLQLFTGSPDSQIVSDSLQSEQGTRFLGKYNRNMVVLVASGEPLETSDSFSWFPVNSLLPLLTEDFLINTDARSVLVTSPWKLLAGEKLPFSPKNEHNQFHSLLFQSYTAEESEVIHSFDEIISRLQQVRFLEKFDTQAISLFQLTSWRVTESSIISNKSDGLLFKQYQVYSSDREINCWDQPLASSNTAGNVILLCQVRNGVLHFLFNIRGEIGFREGFQYGPTVQLSGDESYLSEAGKDQELYLYELSDSSSVVVSCKHSDEGGRFYRCISDYSIRLLSPDQQVEQTPYLSWMSLAQIERLLQSQGAFSNEARSLISMLLTYV